VLPLVFGRVDGPDVAYRGPGCVAVGEVVADCLEEQGIEYAWDGAPGSPIFLLAGRSLPGAEDGFYGPVRAAFPDGAFEAVAGNQVRLLNVAAARRLVAGSLPGPVRRPRVGDHVKLGFVTQDAAAPSSRQECGTPSDRVQLECMWVEVTSARGQHPRRVYRGKLLNVPRFIDPARLRIDAPVEFTLDHVYPEEGQ
jgi:hypothetical protein